MGKDTVVVGVATPGVRTIQRTRHKLAEAEWLALCVPEKDGSDIVVLKGRDGRKLRSFGAGHHHITCFVADPTEDFVFTGGRRGEVRAWNYKTGADVWQNTRLAPDPHNRRRHVVPGKDPKCTLLVYGVGDFDEEQLGDVLVARELTDSRPQWASVCPPTAAGSDTLSTWALVGLATAEAAAECLERSERWAPEFLTAESRSRGDDGRLLKIYKFDPARADERDLLGFGAMRMMRQDHGQPVTALALHETEHMQWIFAGCEDTSVRAMDGETGLPLWLFAGYSGRVQAMSVSSSTIFCSVGARVLSLNVHQHQTDEFAQVAGSFEGNLGTVTELRMTKWDDDTRPGGKLEVMFTGSDNGTVYALHAQKDGQFERLWSFPPDAMSTQGDDSGSGRVRRFRGRVTSLTVVPPDELRSDLASGNAIVIAGSRDHTVRALDATTGEHLWCFPELLEYQTSSPKARKRGFSKAILNRAISDDRNLRIGHSAAVTATAVALQVQCDDGSSDMVLSGSEDHTVCALSLRTGEQRWCYRGCRGSVTGLAVTAHSVLVLAQDHIVHAVDLKNGRQDWSFAGRQAPITAMAVWQRRKRFVLVRSREPAVGNLSMVEAGPSFVGHAHNQTLWASHNDDRRLLITKSGLEKMQVTANEGNSERASHLSSSQIDALFARFATEAALSESRSQAGGSSRESDVTMPELSAHHSVSDSAHIEDRIEKAAKKDGFFILQEQLEEHFVDEFGEEYRLLTDSSNACEICLRRRPTHGEPTDEDQQAVPVWCGVCARQRQVGTCVVEDETQRWHTTLSWYQDGVKHWLFEGQSDLVNGLAILPGIPRFRLIPGEEQAEVNGWRDMVDVVINVSEDSSVRAMDSSTGSQLWVFTGHITSVTAVAVVDQRSAKCFLKQLETLEEKVASSSLETLRESPDTCAIFQEVADMYPKHIAALMRTGESSSSHDKAWRHKEIELKAAIKSAVRRLVPATIVTGDKSAGETSATVRSLSEDGQELWMFDGHFGDITALAFAKRRRMRRKDPRLNDPLHVFSGSEDSTVRCLHSVTGDQLWVFDGHNEGITALASTAHNVFSGAKDHTVRCLDIHDGTQVWVFRHTEQVTALAVDRKYVYVGGRLGKILMLPAKAKVLGAVVRPVHIIADAHTASITGLAIASHRFTGSYLYSASNKIVLSPITPIERLGIVTFVDLADAGNIVTYSTQVLKPPAQLLARVAGRLAAAAQIASFAFTPETVPELPPEYQAKITFFGDFSLDLGGYDQAFAIAMAASATFVAALFVQEDVEFDHFMNPTLIRYAIQWQMANAIAILSAGFLFIPVIKTEVRVIGCSQKNGVWYFDAKSVWSLADGSGSGSAVDIDSSVAMECLTLEHMAYVVPGLVMLFFHILLSIRLTRVYLFMELLEIRRNLLDFRGDSTKKLPAEHAMSIERGEHAMIELLCKVVIVSSKVLAKTSLDAGMYLFFASGVLLFASFRIPPYYGFQANRLLFSIHFLVFWVSGTTLGALWDRFLHPDATFVQENENSWWIGVPLVYFSFPLAIFMFLVVPYIPYSYLYEVRWAKKKKEAEEEKDAQQFQSNEHRPHILNWIDSNHDGHMDRQELDRLLVLAGQDPTDDDMYLAMCADIGVSSPDKGFSSTQFVELLSQLEKPGNVWNRIMPDSTVLDRIITSTDVECTLIVHGSFRDDMRGKKIKKDFAQYGQVVRCTVRDKFDDEKGMDTSWALVTMANAEQAKLVEAANGKPYDGARLFSVETAINSKGLLEGLATRHLSHTDVKIAEARFAKDERSIRRRTPEQWKAIEHKRQERARREKECLPKVLDWVDRNHDGVLGRNELNRLIEAMHWEPLSDDDYERMSEAVGANDQADAWYWFDRTHDTWVPYSETDAEKLETGFRNWSGEGQLLVDVVDDSKTVPGRPRHRVHMTRVMEADGKSYSLNLVERTIVYDDKDDGGHRSRRAQQAEDKDGTPVRRGLGFTKTQFLALQRLKHSEERKIFSEPVQFVPDRHDSGILTRRGLDVLLHKAWKPPSDKQYTAMCTAIWKHNSLGTSASEQEFIAELRDHGFSWDQILHLQECHDWDNHNWRTGKAEMFLPTTETMYNAIQANLAAEKEYACREAVVKYLDKDGNNELQLSELRELVELSGDDAAALDEITYRHMIRAAGGDESKEMLTVDDFDRLLTDFQELGWVPSCTDMYSVLVDQGKLDPCVQNLGKFASELNPHDAVMEWVDGDQNGKLDREELNKLLAACYCPITDADWRLMCDAGGADPKIGFNEAQFLRLQHATFSFSHSWLPSSTELYGAIMELHGEVALHPDPDARDRDYAQSHLQEAMTGRPFGGVISRVMLDKVFQHLGRSPLTDDEYEQLFETVGQNSYRDVWFYFAENFDDLADGTYQHEWVPFRLVDCQKLTDATAARLASPLIVTISDGDVVDLSRWTSDGIATRHSNHTTSRDSDVQQGAGLSAKELIYLANEDRSFPSALDICTALHTIIPKHNVNHPTTPGTDAELEASHASEFVNPVAVGATFEVET